MKRYYWYSQRGFANEGIIFVTEGKEEYSKLIDYVEENEDCNSEFFRTTRKYATTDKNFLAGYNLPGTFQRGIDEIIEDSHKETVKIIGGG